MKLDKEKKTVIIDASKRSQQMIKQLTDDYKLLDAAKKKTCAELTQVKNQIIAVSVDNFNQALQAEELGENDSFTDRLPGATLTRSVSYQTQWDESLVTPALITQLLIMNEEGDSKKKMPPVSVRFDHMQLTPQQIEFLKEKINYRVVRKRTKWTVKTNTDDGAAV